MRRGDIPEDIRRAGSGFERDSITDGKVDAPPRGLREAWIRLGRELDRRRGGRLPGRASVKIRVT